MSDSQGKIARPRRRLTTYKQRLSAANFLPDEDDYLFMQGRPTRDPSGRFLGRYREKSIYKTFEKYGMIQQAHKMGFEQIEVRMLPNESTRQRLKILALKEGQVVLLSDIIVSEDKSLKLDPAFVPMLADKCFNTLVIQWIRLQNPLAKFTPERPALPGQHYPGLGVGNSTMKMLIDIGIYNGYQLITNSPEFFHNALMYHPQFKYLDPLREGQLKALWRDLQHIGLAPLSWAVYLGCVRLNGLPFEWFHGEQINPLCPEVRDYFSSAAYGAQVDKVMAESCFTLDEAQYQEMAPLDASGQSRITLDSNPQDCPPIYLEEDRV